jgi:hypothetical protein
MKKIFAVLFLLLNLYSQAQIQDLAEMASGDLVNFQALYDHNEKFYGYFSLYNQGDINENSRKFEFIILDKNLNKVSSNTFEGEKKNLTYTAFFDINGDVILAPYLDSSQLSIWGIGKFVFPEYKKIDLKTSKVVTYYGKCYENNAFVNCEPNKSWRESKKDIKAERKTKGYIDESYVSVLKKGKLLVRQYKDYDKYIKDNVIMYFDENEKMVWKYEYNNLADKKNSEIITKIDIDDKAFYGIKKITQNKKNTYKLIVLDINTGKVLAENPIDSLYDLTLDVLVFYGLVNNSNPFVIPTDVKIFEDKIVLFNFNYEKGENGYARLIIDKNNYTTTGKTINYKEDLQSFIPKINNYGYVESGYKLNKKDVFILKDGSIGILTEKFKPAGQYSRMKTTDMVYIVTDKDFKVKEVKTLEKEKSKGQYTDYLFSQYLKDNQDVVFFYKDFQKDDESKDKNWILFINTLQNGVFNQEQVTISSKNDKFMIYPYVAKEGYILLREYNEKDKYNQIRLEKLNY